MTVRHTQFSPGAQSPWSATGCPQKAAPGHPPLGPHSFIHLAILQVIKSFFLEPRSVFKPRKAKVKTQNKQKHGCFFEAAHSRMGAKSRQTSQGTCYNAVVRMMPGCNGKQSISVAMGYRGLVLADTIPFNPPLVCRPTKDHCPPKGTLWCAAQDTCRTEALISPTLGNWCLGAPG